MTWILILFIATKGGWNTVTSKQPSLEMCQKIGIENTVSHPDPKWIKTGTYWDGKPWKVAVPGHNIGGQFDKFSCVPNNESP